MGITLFQRLLTPLFGTFNPEEFKKFLRLGFIFTLIIGAYWTLSTLRNAIFCLLVGPSEIPYAKSLTLITIFVFLLLYSTILDHFGRRKTFYILSIAYALGTVLFGFLISIIPIQQCSPDVAASFSTRVIAYTGYVFTESYVSLMVSLFWAIASDTTKPASAKQGFYLVTAIGQMGGIFFPYLIPKLTSLFNFETIGFSIGTCAIIMLVSIYACYNYFAYTPANLLVSYQPEDTSNHQKEESQGFFDGLWLLIKTPYLLGIFANIFFFEFIITVFDLHFHAMAVSSYKGIALSEYLGLYGSAVNLTAFLCLILGVSNIPRFLGIKITLCLMPCIMAFAILGFFTLDSLAFLFILMVASKALNYALNNPAIKQLYIPTSREARFKAQAWIESFGSRGSKQIGSIFNMLLKPLQLAYGITGGRMLHIQYGAYTGSIMVVIWFFVAMFLGTTYQRAIKEDKLIT